MDRHPNAAVRLVLGFVLVVACLLWLPVVRGFTQSQYEWQLFGLGGQGRSGDYLALLALSAATWVTLLAGWRWCSSGIGRVGILAWCAGLTAAIAVFTLRSSEPLVLRGDTLGIDIPIGWIGAGLAGVMFGLAALGLFAFRSGPARRPWSKLNGIAATTAMLMFPVIGLTLIGHDVNGTFSQIGVAAVLVQALAIGLTIRTSRVAGSAELSDARMSPAFPT